MLRFNVSVANVFRSVLKSQLRVFKENENYRTIIHLPDSVIAKAFFTTGSSNAAEKTIRTDMTSKTEKIPAMSSNISEKNITSNTATQDKEQDPSVDDETAKKSREFSWRTMKYTLIAIGLSALSGGVYLLFELGKPMVDDEGTVVADEFSNKPVWQQYIYRTLRELDYYKRLIKEPSRDKLLPDVLKYPYYQPPYTLILEITDVLVHPDWTYKTGWRFKKRPGVDHFLESLNGMYEIVIYTAEQGMTVFPLIEVLDPKNIISYKLVRDATHFVDGHHVKNLDKLNRDLNKVVVIDWNMDSVKFHPENVLRVNRWPGNDDDTTLIDLAAFLRTIAQSEITDVREVLTYYNKFDDPLATFRERQKKLMEQEEADRDAKAGQQPPPVKRWTPSFLNRVF